MVNVKLLGGKQRFMILKRSLVLIIVIFAGLYLSACNSQVSTSSQPSIAVGSLDTAEAYLKRGDQYSEIKDFDHAIADYSQAILLKPNYAEAYNNRGFAHSIFGKIDVPKAIADFSQAIKLRPTYAYAYNNRGVAYMASGYPDEAIRDFDHAIELQPDFPQAYNNRANAYFRAGRIGLAISDFYRAGTLGHIAIVFGISMLIVLIGARLTYRVIHQRRLAQRRNSLEIH